MRCIGIWRDVTERVRVSEKLGHQAATDPLTGTYNIRFFQEIAGKELARAHRDGRPVSVLMLDIDYFKKFNDEHGHQLGDRVLKDVATTCSESIRSSDTLARYGGEEFVVLLPGADRAAALQIAETLRGKVDGLTVPISDRTLSVTVSVGVASAKDDPNLELSDLIEQADHALYQAKRRGRNRCVPFEAGSANHTT